MKRRMKTTNRLCLLIAIRENSNGGTEYIKLIEIQENRGKKLGKQFLFDF
jgi:hypothetical protein